MMYTPLIPALEGNKRQNELGTGSLSVERFPTGKNSLVAGLF